MKKVACILLLLFAQSCTHDLDAPRPGDASLDKTAPDLPQDRGADRADLPVPDAAKPDRSSPDVPLPDVALPDQPKPDLPSDLLQPDLFLPDKYVPGCNNGVLDPGEQCDGKLLNKKTCKTKGFDGGKLACKTNCDFDTTGCSKCGDGKLGKGEDCDGKLLGGKTCVDLKLSGGTLGCKSTCVFDTSACTWLVSVEGQYSNFGIGIVADKAANIYVTGLFKGQATFGSMTLVSKGSQDTFVAKLDPQGNYVWVTGAGYSGKTNATDLALDSSGNLYVVGYFDTKTSFGSTTHTANGHDEIYVGQRLGDPGAVDHIGLGGRSRPPEVIVPDKGFRGASHAKVHAADFEQDIHLWLAPAKDKGPGSRLQRSSHHIG